MDLHETEDGEVLISNTSTPVSLANGLANQPAVDDSDDEFSFGLPAALGPKSIKKPVQAVSSSRNYQSQRQDVSAAHAFSTTKPHAKPVAQARPPPAAKLKQSHVALEDSDDEFDFGVSSSYSAPQKASAPPPRAVPAPKYGTARQPAAPARQAAAPPSRPSSQPPAPVPKAAPVPADASSKAQWLAQGRNGVDNRPAWMKSTPAPSAAAAPKSAPVPPPAPARAPVPTPAPTPATRRSVDDSDDDDAFDFNVPAAGLPSTASHPARQYTAPAPQQAPPSYGSAPTRHDSHTSTPRGPSTHRRAEPDPRLAPSAPQAASGTGGAHTPTPRAAPTASASAVPSRAGADSDSDDLFDFAESQSTGATGGDRVSGAAAAPAVATHNHAAAHSTAPQYHASGDNDDDGGAFDFSGGGHESPLRRGAAARSEPPQRTGLYATIEQRHKKPRRNLGPNLSLLSRAGGGGVNHWGGGGGGGGTPSSTPTSLGPLPTIGSTGTRQPSYGTPSPHFSAPSPHPGGAVGHPPFPSTGGGAPSVPAAPPITNVFMTPGGDLVRILPIDAISNGGGLYDPTSCLDDESAAPPSRGSRAPSAGRTQRSAKSGSTGKSHSSSKSVSRGSSHASSASDAGSQSAARRSGCIEVMLPSSTSSGASSHIAMEAIWKPFSRSTDPTAWPVPALLTLGRQHIGTAKVGTWWPKPKKGAPKPAKHFWRLDPPRNDKESWDSFREVSAFLVDKNACLKRTLPDGVELAILHTSSRGVQNSGMGKMPTKALIALAFDHPQCMTRAGASADGDAPSPRLASSVPVAAPSRRSTKRSPKREDPQDDELPTGPKRAKAGENSSTGAEAAAAPAPEGTAADDSPASKLEECAGADSDASA